MLLKIQAFVDCYVFGTAIPTDESFQKIRDFNTWFNEEVDFVNMYLNI